MDNSTSFLAKQLTLNLEENEWLSLLTHYGKNATWGGDEGLLQIWPAKRSIPTGVVHWINEHIGPEIWTTPNNSGQSPFEVLCAHSNLSRSTDALVALTDVVPLNTYIETFEKLIDNQVEKQNGLVLMQQPLDYWRGIFAVVAGSMRGSAIPVATALLEKHPHLLEAEQDGYRVGALLGSSEMGWDHYLKAGGSIFQQIDVDPATNASSQEEGQPLWLWFLKKKMYHSKLKSTLDQLMVRLMEGREPSEGDYVLSDHDWEKLVDNKGLILNEIRMIEFEKKIESDWKAAIKENKKWREWRSSEGANFMLWLCAKNPAEFIRQAHKTKINQPLIKTKDDLGRDFFQYLLTGCLIADFGTWKRSNRVKGELYPEMLKTMEPLINKNPDKGLMVDWCTASTDAYFGALKSASNINGGYHQEYLRDIMRKNEGLFWNGLEYDALKQVFQNPVISTRLLKLGPALFPAYSSEQIQGQYEKMDDKTKLAFTVFAFSSAMDHIFTQELSTWRNHQAEKLMSNFPEGVSSQDVKNMGEWVEKNTSSWNKSDAVRSLEAALQRQLIALALREKKEAEIQEEEPIPKAAKRRM